ncbi:MAG: hypothetical protein V1750_00880 [Acidobacteriota bacterium]
MIVFLSLATVGLVFLLISAFFGDHVDAHPEIEVGSFGFLSVRLLAVFLTAFGTVGAISRWYDQPALHASLWGLAAAFPLSGIYGLAMKMLRSQQASSLVEEGELVNCTARVTVAIAAESFGEVSCPVKAQIVRRMARGAAGEPYPEGAIVRIVEVQGDIVLVEPKRKT